MTHDRPAQPQRQAPTAEPAGSQSEGSFKDDPDLRLMIIRIVRQELARHSHLPRAKKPGRSRGRGRRGSGSELKRQQVWAREEDRRRQQRQDQGLLAVSHSEAEAHYRGRYISRGFRSWQCAAAESSNKAAAMAVAVQHSFSSTPRKASRDNLADKHQYLCWWRACRAVRAPFSPWPDPNAPAFVPTSAPSEGPLARTRAGSARAAVCIAAPKDIPGSAAEGDAKNSTVLQEERWHSWMENYHRMEDLARCEGCGKQARLWICDCGAGLCSSHCMGHCSFCGGEDSWDYTDSDSEDSDTLSEDY
jgi:hypothetical protein